TWFVSRQLPAPPVFPYTTLFRSDHAEVGEDAALEHVLLAVEHLDLLALGDLGADARLRVEPGNACPARTHPLGKRALRAELDLRSEEHTSELQSRENLVCRLLLE